MAHIVSGNAGPPERKELITRYVINDYKRRLNILLVEDVDINQKVATKFLEKQGHRVVVANNGREGFERWEQEVFDIVFMDVQMPEMDGYQTTAAIRAKEQGSGRHTPISAMTAYAMKGDAEKCLDSGMDAYITKPIKVEELLMTIEKLVGRTEPHVKEAAVGQPPEPSTAAGRLLNWTGLVDSWDGDREFAEELLITFIQQLAQQRICLAEAVASADPKEVSTAAHSLKGSLLAIMASPAADTALILENMGRMGDITMASTIWQHLDGQLTTLAAEIDGILAG
jgi:CheY-like chemotaxis protein